MKQNMAYLIHEESDQLEFKEDFNEGALKTICAFANTRGGTLVIGINSKKKYVGVEINDEKLQNITHKIVNKIGIMPDIRINEVDKKNILEIHVQKFSIPVSYEGRYYKRVGNTTREMNSDELKRFFQRDLRWERLTDNTFTIDEIDEQSVRNFLRTAQAKGRLTAFNGEEPIEEVLEKLGLMENGKINNAGVFVFGRNPQKYFDHAKVRLLHMKDDITIIGDRWIEGNLFTQYLETENAIKNFINVRYEIKGFERTDIWDYPLEAIREAIANALLHRDYLRPVKIQIKIFSDRIWFYNVGGLPEDWTADKLFKLHSSIPRNPTIFHIFYLAGIVENVGSGIERMSKALKEAKLPQLEIEANPSDFTLLFYKDIYTEENLRKMGLNERQIKAVMYVKEKGRITNKEYQELNIVSKRTATRDLENLLKREIVQQIGTTGKGTEYILKGVSMGSKGSKRGLNGAK
ncbi:MAG TPA: ATP-binding protein [Victivallales bacterium]|nr:ATP-binding protein [Victivallales bacterium]HRR27960.1 ATP-binding protein [Victivallales bacterium]